MFLVPANQVTGYILLVQQNHLDDLLKPDVAETSQLWVGLKQPNALQIALRLLTGIMLKTFSKELCTFHLHNWIDSIV